MSYLRGTTLLRQVPALDGESLFSRIVRQANANHLPTATPIFTALNVPTTGSPITSRYLDALTVARAAAILGLEPALVRAMTVHAFTSSFIATSDPWLSETDYFRVRSYALRYCPACVAEQRYHRLIWEINLLPVCLTHQCFLEERCPGCRAKVTLPGLLTGVCPTCQASLTDTGPHPHPHPDEDILTHAALFLAWVQGKPFALPAVWGVLAAPPSFLILLWVELANFIDVEQWRWWPAGRSYPQTVPSLYQGSYRLSLAFTLLCHWPTAFTGYALRTLRTRSSSAGQSDLVDWFARSWDDPRYADVRRAVETEILQQPPEVAWSLPLLQRDLRFQAQYRLAYRHHLATRGNVSDACIQTMEASGIIPPPEEGAAHFCPRKDDECLVSWQDEPGVLVAEVAAWLNLDDSLIAQGVKDGIFTARGMGGIEPTSITRFVATVLQGARAYRQHPPSVELPWVPLRHLLMRMGDHVGLILKALSTGDLVVNVPGDLTTALGTFLIHPDRVASWFIRSQGWRSTSELARQWHVPLWVVNDWIANGLVVMQGLPWLRDEPGDARQSRRWGTYCAPEARQHWRTTYIFAGTAAQQLGVTPARMRSWIADGVITPVWRSDKVPTKQWLLSRTTVDTLPGQTPLSATEAS